MLYLRKIFFNIAMILIGATLIFGVLFFSLANSVFSPFRPAMVEATIRYRLTIDVATPDGLKSGSGVVQVVYYAPRTKRLQSSEWNAQFSGEAVAVDLGSRGVLFALLKEGQDPRSAPEYIVLRAFGFPYGAMPSPATDGIPQIAALRGSAPVAPQSLPLLVRFRDPYDPKTVEQVDPLNLAASFGEGFRILSAVIEITNDPVTYKIDKMIPSYGTNTGFLEWYRSLPFNSPIRVGRWDFIRETE